MDEMYSFSLVDLSDLTDGSTFGMYDGCKKTHGQCGAGCGCGVKNGVCGGWDGTSTTLEPAAE